MAVYRSGQTKPEAYFNNIDVDKNINFNKYRSFTPSSKESALWDIQGVKIRRMDLPEKPEINPFLHVGLDWVKKLHLKHQRYEWRCNWARKKWSEGMKNIKGKYWPSKIKIFV